jgi:hypothetical protein
MDPMALGSGCCRTRHGFELCQCDFEFTVTLKVQQKVNVVMLFSIGFLSPLCMSVFTSITEFAAASLIKAT